MPNSIAWEYRVITTGAEYRRPKDDELEAMLNELGAAGWEVISVLGQAGANQLRIIAKRPKAAA